MVSVNADDDDFRMEGEEVLYSRENNDEEVFAENEELDYDSAGLDDKLGITHPEDQFELVDSVVEFRIPRTTVTEEQQQSEMQQGKQNLINANDLEGYIQSIVDSKWKECEAELLKKHNIPAAGKPGENKNTNRRIQVSDSGERGNEPQRERIKSPSDTTIYAPALNRTL